MNRFLVFVAAVLVAASSIEAHHSISGVYDTTHEVKIEGTVAEFRFVNPHPFVIINVLSAGRAQSWKLELDNRSELVEVGMTDQTLKPGDHVIVSGSPAKARDALLLYIRKLDRPSDGFQYEQVGTSPRVRFGSGSRSR